MNAITSSLLYKNKMIFFNECPAKYTASVNIIESVTLLKSVKRITINKTIKLSIKMKKKG